ncbi:zinc-ribbon domain-containing protein [Bifidobacterium sp. LC6]|uniref:Zinc-ribbon domain-containing protein n=1 Tax=Bifidobacterium colobi TaxID=2809026 RepID=A0ABS5UY40_9BIFI|nr:zinc-ribbon domain-containing protein [Bifidobacterium colobi]MBT1175616.1 zinc-ribbon domain-containing protein [Bifidobacterium colobi]
MFCPKCGAQHNPGIKFCPRCGTPQPQVMNTAAPSGPTIPQTSAQAPQVPLPPRRDTAWQQPVSRQQYTATQQPAAPQYTTQRSAAPNSAMPTAAQTAQAIAKKSFNGKMKYLLIGAAALVMLFILGFLLLPGAKTTNSGNGEIGNTQSQSKSSSASPLKVTNLHSKQSTCTYGTEDTKCYIVTATVHNTSNEIYLGTPLLDYSFTATNNYGEKKSYTATNGDVHQRYDGVGLDIISGCMVATGAGDTCAFAPGEQREMTLYVPYNGNASNNFALTKFTSLVFNKVKGSDTIDTVQLSDIDFKDVSVKDYDTGGQILSFSLNNPTKHYWWDAAVNYSLKVDGKPYLSGNTTCVARKDATIKGVKPHGSFPCNGPNSLEKQIVPEGKISDIKITNLIAYIDKDAE